ncbi:MAG: NADH-quinone oxidoreductase subunit G, partial [Moraxella sp.]|nr:NADH-quinone oxidoreductase subunit G [Moraxella sp.]
ESGQFESEFSGNLTEVCPTGVFTDKTHSDRYNRKWDMQYAPSICHGCSTGCSISAGERYGELRRIENRYNPDVNGYFLCDKGRFGYGYINRADRPLQPTEKVDGKHIKINADFALDKAIEILKGKKTIGIGSPTASLESNFALKRLVGDDNYSTGERQAVRGLVSSAVNLLRHEDVHNVSLAQIETADCVFILGEDLTQTASRVALSVRQAAKNKAKSMATALRTEHWLAEPVKRIGQDAYSPIYVTAVCDTKLDDVAKVSVVATPQDVARLGFMVGDIIATFADELVAINEHETAIFAKEKSAGQLSEEEAMTYLAHHIAYDLVMADKPLVISGTSLGSSDVVAACGYVATMLTAKREKIKHVEREYIEVHNNKLLAAETQTPSHDADKLNRPENDGTPADVKLEAQVVRNPDVKLLEENKAYAQKVGVYMVLPAANSAGLELLSGLSIEEVLAKDFEVAVILHHNLMNLSAAQKTQLFEKTLIVLDHESYDWHNHAELVLSAASFAEGDGTLVSAEGRAQRFFAAYDKKYYVPLSDIKDAWRWLGAIGHEVNDAPMWQDLDELIELLAVEVPELSGIIHAAPASDYRIRGLKLAREPRRYSGRTSLRAKLSVHEPMQPKDKDTALTYSMEGYVGDETPAAAIAFAWSAGWNSPQAWNKFQDKVGGRLKGGDVGVRLFDDLPKGNHVYHSLSVSSLPMGSVFEGRANLVPMYQIFASSDYAHRSPVVASQMPEVTWFVGVDDAKRWQIKDGDVLEISQGDISVVLPVRTLEYLAEGCIGYVVGQVPFMPQLPTHVKKSERQPYFVPPYQEAMNKLVGITGASLSAFNIGQKQPAVTALERVS